MPEYLAPGVYVEEVSFRSKSIEGVPTSTTGFAGMTRFGPVQYTGGPSTTEPRLITSFTEFESVYGGLEPLVFAGGETRHPYLAHAARAFFMNGGKRLYVSRVFAPIHDVDNLGVASLAVDVGGTPATWRARWPGSLGDVRVVVQAVRSGNVAFDAGGGTIQVKRARAGTVIEITAENDPLPRDAPDVANLAVVKVATDGTQTFAGSAGDRFLVAGEVVRIVELQVTVGIDAERTQVFTELGTHHAQKRAITRILERNDPEDENAVVWLDWPPPADVFQAARLLAALAAPGMKGVRLDGGNDGAVPLTADLAGNDADPDDASRKATGLAALGEIDDIAIVAMPDAGGHGEEEARGAADALIAHADNLKYRIAIVDAPKNSSMTEIRKFRGRFDSKYAALYHPWIEILDPTERAAQGAPPARLQLPPSGFVAGIYARTDIERGVHKAPANEIVRGLTRFEININKARNDVLNPEGINALRFFEGRGNRVWGARTMSSDPEWKYVNVRRLFIYLEHSIDKSTQWAVFEPNNDQLWANIRQTVEDFLYVLWKNGALLGRKPEEAYFVRCDRTTMSQNDIDNGRMICLVGVAPTKPAEYVIFRVGQWTADAKV